MVDRLRQRGTMTFRELISDAKDRSELVARFLGLLELYRLGALGFVQADPFSDFTVVWEDRTFDLAKLSLLGAEYDD